MKLAGSCQALCGAAVLMLSLTAHAAVRVPAASCETPPVHTCDKSGCTDAALDHEGNATDPKTGRKFFLDYPCDLEEGEKVTFLLSLHGAGSFGNRQRHYFPAIDFKDQHRLVIATPTAGVAEPLRMWTGPADDEHLRNIVDLVFEQFGAANIRSFWLVGHSQGGMTSNRIVCTPGFRERIDGWLSLSGGRIGRVQVAPDLFAGAPPEVLKRVDPKAPAPGAAALPDCDFSFIFATGDLEITGLPETSPWAEKYSCGARVRKADIVDTEKGYVDRAGEKRAPSYGREARPGTAQVFVYPNCQGGRLVADVLRLDKGHTEGLELRVTEELIKMMISAPSRARR
jgi:pimeloyl-ACP methyl ester carboxylesterase